MPFSPETAVRTSRVASLVRLTPTPGITARVASVVVPVRAPVEAVWERPNEAKPKTIITAVMAEIVLIFVFMNLLIAAIRHIQAAGLEAQLQCELHKAGIHRRGRDLPERTRAEIRIRIRELRCVEQVEEFRSEFDVSALF